jgi:hypothetical protein
MYVLTLEASAEVLPVPEPNTSFPEAWRCEVPADEPGPDVLLFVRWDVVSVNGATEYFSGFPSRRLPTPVKGVNLGSSTSFDSSEIEKPPNCK